MTLIFILSLASCAVEKLNIKVSNPDKAMIPDSEEFFLLINQNTNHIVGFAYRKIQHYITSGRLYYQYNQDFHLKMRYEDNEQLIRIHEKSESKVDRNFRLLSFTSDNRINDSRRRFKGYLGKKYFYLKEFSKSGDIDSRIRLSNIIYSDLLEDYLARHHLKKQGNAATFYFFNLSTINVEEERFIFEDIAPLDISQKKIPSLHFLSTNYATGERKKFWYNQNFKLIQKSIFKDAVKWESRSLDEKKSFDFEYSVNR